MIVYTRGLPGSGKTTIARRWVQETESGSRIYVDRDSLRMMLFGRWNTWLRDSEERAVTEVQHATICTALNNGRSVIVANTFLLDERIEPLAEIAENFGVPLECIDLRHVPVDVCVQRDIMRGLKGERMVGAMVIHDMAERHNLPLEVTA